MAHPQRRKLLIDRPIQLAVLFRTLMYWAMCTVAQLLMVLFVALVTSSQQDLIANGPQLLWHLQISLIASTVLLPLILLDVLKLSHRWVGPIFRLRASLRALSRGEPVSPVRFRKQDFWQDLAGDLNAVATELNRHQAAALEEATAQASRVAVTTPTAPQSGIDRASSAIAP